MRASNCTCGKNHKNLMGQHKCIGKQIGKNAETRGNYDEIIGYGVGKNEYGGMTAIVRAVAILALFRDCLTAEYCEFDRKGRGSALNHDLYGYDPSQGVAVIQARQCIGTKYGKTSHKTYFLAGHNEITGSPFCHPVGSHAIRAAINAGANSIGVVIAAQKWMWEVTDAQLKISVRQGDLLLVPESKLPGDAVTVQAIGDNESSPRNCHMMTLAGSHVLHAAEIRKNGRIYALDPQLIHNKDQHAPVAVNGWASVRIAREAPAWDFAERKGD